MWHDGKTNMAFPLNSKKLVFLVGLLPVFVETAVRQELPHECTPEEVGHCYRGYIPHLWRRSVQDGSEGSIRNEDLTRWCREITAKIHCHQRLALCPEEVRTKYSLQERGYEALRHFFCDEDAVRGYYTARTCQDPEKLIPCHDEYMEGITPGNTKHFSCQLSEAAIGCYERAFTPTCGMTLNSAKAAFLRGEDTLLLLSDCNGSMRRHVATEHLLLTAAVAALVLLQWTGGSSQLNVEN
ncbi:uncharacterized protein LOC144106738 isoform X2 [Amblyomma americanum]